jgi:hypothetical protein
MSRCKKAPWYWPFHDWVETDSEYFSGISRSYRNYSCKKCYAEDLGVERGKKAEAEHNYEIAYVKGISKLKRKSEHSQLLLDIERDKNIALLHVKHDNGYIAEFAKRRVGAK